MGDIFVDVFPEWAADAGILCGASGKPRTTIRGKR